MHVIRAYHAYQNVDVALCIDDVIQYRAINVQQKQRTSKKKKLFYIVGSVETESII